SRFLSSSVSGFVGSAPSVLGSAGGVEFSEGGSMTSGGPPGTPGGGVCAEAPATRHAPSSIPIVDAERIGRAKQVFRGLAADPGMERTTISSYRNLPPIELTLDSAARSMPAVRTG